MQIAMIGAGYVGLVSSVCFAEFGADVICVDKDASKVEALQGKFIFGDLVRGRLFAADVDAMKAADDGIPETVAAIEEIQLYVVRENGKRVYVAFRDLIERANGATAARADMHLSRSRDGEILITSRQDGWIRMFVPD